MGAHNFTSLQQEFERFCEITGEPHENGEIAEWVQRLKDQGEKVIELIAEMEECRFFGPYDKIQTDFQDNVGALQRALRDSKVKFELQTLER